MPSPTATFTEIHPSLAERHTMAPPNGRNLSDEEAERIALKVIKTIREDLIPSRKPSPEMTKPIHEMSEAERTQYANEVWLAAGIVPIRPTVTDAVHQAEVASIFPKPRGYDPMRGETPPGGAK